MIQRSRIIQITTDFAQLRQHRPIAEPYALRAKAAGAAAPRRSTGALFAAKHAEDLAELGLYRATSPACLLRHAQSRAWDLIDLAARATGLQPARMRPVEAEPYSHADVNLQICGAREQLERAFLARLLPNSAAQDTLELKYREQACSRGGTRELYFELAPRLGRLRRSGLPPLYSRDFRLVERPRMYLPILTQQLRADGWCDTMPALLCPGSLPLRHLDHLQLGSFTRPLAPGEAPPLGVEKRWRLGPQAALREADRHQHRRPMSTACVEQLDSIGLGLGAMREPRLRWRGSPMVWWPVASSSALSPRAWDGSPA